MAAAGAADGHRRRTHAAQFLTWRRCGHVLEMRDHDVSSVLTKLVMEAGFSNSTAAGEAEERRSSCRMAPATPFHGN